MRLPCRSSTNRPAQRTDNRPAAYAPDRTGTAGLGTLPGVGIWTDRGALAEAVCAALNRACDGSQARLIGSLGAGTADAFSDIDVEWIVPDARFPDALATGTAALERVATVADVRLDPDFHHSARRRLLFVRFAHVPLFWRLDLDVRAASADAGYDVGNPAVRAGDAEWSRPASALANAIGAVKAVARDRPASARGLLDRGFARIGADAGATGAWRSDITRLARAAAAQDPALEPLAQQVIALAAEHPA